LSKEYIKEYTKEVFENARIVCKENII